MDSYETAPYLSARWQGGEDMKGKIQDSFRYSGECCRILEKSVSGGVPFDEIARELINAIAQIKIS